VIKDWDRSADLGKIAVPTLITTGEFDEITLDCQETLHNGIAESKLVVLPGCSHLTMLEQPEVHNGLLRKFMA
jgi:proline iminopeptidase